MSDLADSDWTTADEEAYKEVKQKERERKTKEQKEFREKILAAMDSKLGDWLSQCKHPFMQAARDAPDSQVVLNLTFERIHAEYEAWVNISTESIQTPQEELCFKTPDLKKSFEAIKTLLTTDDATLKKDRAILQRCVHQTVLRELFDTSYFPCQQETPVVALWYYNWLQQTNADVRLLNKCNEADNTFLIDTKIDISSFRDKIEATYYFNWFARSFFQDVDENGVPEFIEYDKTKSTEDVQKAYNVWHLQSGFVLSDPEWSQKVKDSFDPCLREYHQLVEMRSNIKTQQATIDKLQEELEDSAASLEESVKLLENTEEQKNKIQTDCDKLVTEKTDLQKQIDDLQTKLQKQQNTEEQNTQLSETLKTLEKTKIDMEKQILLLQSARNEANIEMLRQAQNVKYLKEQILNQQKDITEQQKKLCDEKMEKMKTEFDDKKTRFDLVIQEQKKQFEDQIALEKQKYEDDLEKKEKKRVTDIEKLNQAIQLQVQEAEDKNKLLENDLLILKDEYNTLFSLSEQKSAIITEYKEKIQQLTTSLNKAENQNQMDKTFIEAQDNALQENIQNIESLKEEVENLKKENKNVANSKSEIIKRLNDYVNNAEASENELKDLHKELREAMGETP